MGEESIAQKPHTRRRGTVEDGRKRTTGEKERLICTQESRQSGCGKKIRKNPNRKK